jgi:PAS domain S-box-containing protein
MTGLGVFSWIAGALQLGVPSYALRLVRRFGALRVGWFIVTAFASLALMHSLVLLKPAAAGPASGLTLDLFYVVGSVLLLVGMGHMESLLSERERADWTEQSLRRKWESRLREETAELMATREELAYELARREEIIKTLEESEAQYRFLFVEHPQPMWILDLRSCRFLAINKAALRQYGFTSEEFMALTGRDLLLPSAVSQFLQDAARPCSGVETRGVWQHCRKDGTLLDVEITAVDLSFAGVPARLILASDVTQRRRRELKMRKVHRMEVISQVAGGIAHHFNSLFILVESEAAALRERPLDLQSAGQLDHIHAAVTRAAGLTRQLLAAGGRQLMRQEPLDLNGLIRHMNPMLRRLAGERIVLQHTCGSHLFPVLADRHLVEHVIVNLVLNARDAMPGGGTLTIGTVKVHLDEDPTRNDPQIRAGDFVRLEVRDTGCGMTPQVQSRLFEPFFTTREPGKGVGLGLASVYGIVNQHSGWIEVASEAGAGSEFRVFLPCLPGAFSVPNAEPQSATAFGKRTILLVEPDDRARALAHFVLHRHGYRVIEADSSATALVLWVGQGPTVDLLLTDLELAGGISGRELADQFRQTRPGLKVIHTAASDSSCGRQPPAQMEGSAFVPKPYNPESLLQAVEASLGA